MVILGRKVEVLEDEVRTKTKDNELLERKVAELRDIQIAFHNERRRREDLERAAAVPLPSSPDTDLLEKINILEAQLTTSRLHPASSTQVDASIPVAKQIRKLEREVEKLRRDLSAAEEDVEKLDLENLSLKANQPLPGSPIRGSRILSGESDGLVRDLESRIAELTRQLEGGETSNGELTDLQTRLSVVQDELSVTRTRLQNEESLGRSLKSDIEVSSLTLSAIYAHLVPRCSLLNNKSLPTS
jgi:hypothetical protein